MGVRGIVAVVVFGCDTHTVVCSSKALESIPENHLEL
jgi:hypothetical protein